MKTSEYMSDFFVNQVFRGFAVTKKKKSTADNYFLAANYICDFCKKDFLELTREDAKAYREYLETHVREDGTRVNERTIKMRYVGYNQLARYIAVAYPDAMEENPFEFIALPETNEKLHYQRIPGVEDIDKLLTAAKDDPQAYLIISLISRMGLTATEVVKLTKQQVKEYGENGEIGILEMQKDGKTETLRPAPEDIKELLLGYMEDNHIETALFHNQWKKPLRIRNLDSLLKKYTKLADLKDENGEEITFSVKDLRNHAILSMLQSGADPKDVAEYAGIGMVRANQFVREGNILAACPANLVNFRIVKPN